MKKLIILLIILVIGCEKEYELDVILPPNGSELTIYSDLHYENGTYHLFYPEELSNSYFKVTYNTRPYQRVFWESPDMFYVVMWQDTIWTPVVNFSTYADEDGIGHQMVYINPTLIGDTLNVIGKLNDYRKQEIKIIIHPDCYPLLCNEEGYWY